MTFIGSLEVLSLCAPAGLQSISFEESEEFCRTSECVGAETTRQIFSPLPPPPPPPPPLPMLLSEER